MAVSTSDNDLSWFYFCQITRTEGVFRNILGIVLYGYGTVSVPEGFVGNIPSRPKLSLGSNSDSRPCVQAPHAKQGRTHQTTRSDLFPCAPPQFQVRSTKSPPLPPLPTTSPAVLGNGNKKSQAFSPKKILPPTTIFSQVAAMRGTLIFAGSSCPALTGKICANLGMAPADAELTQFSNGETSVRILTSVREKDVFVVQSGSPKINDTIMELLIMISACKGGSANKITGTSLNWLP